MTLKITVGCLSLASEMNGGNIRLCMTLKIKCWVFVFSIGELAESSATPEYTYTLVVASSAGACNKTMTRSVEIRRRYREFLHMIKNLLNTEINRV